MGGYVWKSTGQGWVGVLLVRRAPRGLKHSITRFAARAGGLPVSDRLLLDACPLSLRCHRKSHYQRATYLGADIAMPAMETPPHGASPHTYLSAATRAVGAAPPQQIGVLAAAAATAASTASPAAPDGSDGQDGEATGLRQEEGGGEAGSDGVLPPWRKVEACLAELEDELEGEACTLAGAARALARIACRLFDLADELGGEPGGEPKQHYLLRQC